MCSSDRWLANVAFRIGTAGVIHADEVPLTGPGGWLDLPTPMDVGRAIGAQPYAPRLRLSLDAHARAHFLAEDVEPPRTPNPRRHPLARARG